MPVTVSGKRKKERSQTTSAGRVGERMSVGGPMNSGKSAGSCPRMRRIKSSIMKRQRRGTSV